MSLVEASFQFIQLSRSESRPVSFGFGKRRYRTIPTPVSRVTSPLHRWITPRIVWATWVCTSLVFGGRNCLRGVSGIDAGCRWDRSGVDSNGLLRVAHGSEGVGLVVRREVFGGLESLRGGFEAILEGNFLFQGRHWDGVQFGSLWKGGTWKKGDWGVKRKCSTLFVEKSKFRIDFYLKTNYLTLFKTSELSEHLKRNWIASYKLTSVWNC